MLQISHHNAGLHTLGAIVSPEKGSVNGNTSKIEMGKLGTFYEMPGLLKKER